MEITTARSFILNRGIVTDTMSASQGGVQCIPCLPGPWSQGGVQSIPLHQLSFKHFHFQASQLLKYKTKPLLRACSIFSTRRRFFLL